MKNVIFDTSVAIKWFFPENGTEEALKLKGRHLSGKINLCTRELFLYEFTSSFINHKSFPIEEKDFTLATYALQSMKLSLVPLEYRDLNEIFNLSKKLKISVYDCSFLLLAKKLRSPLYTADQKLHLAARKLVQSHLI